MISKLDHLDKIMFHFFFQIIRHLNRFYFEYVNELKSFQAKVLHKQIMHTQKVTGIRLIAVLL